MTLTAAHDVVIPRELQGVVDALRRVGVPVATSQIIDAVRALRLTSSDDAVAKRSAMLTTLISHAEHMPTFDTVYQLHAGDGEAVTVDERIARLADDELHELLLHVLAQGGEDSAAADELGLRTVVSEYVTRFAKIVPGQPVAGKFSVFRVLRATDTDALRSGLRERWTHDSAGPLPGLRSRIRDERILDRITQLEQAVEAEVRRRLVADRGADAVHHSLGEALAQDVDFLTASSDEIAHMTELVAPLPGLLARKILDRRRMGQRGPIDVRRTIRAALSTGGAPISLRYRAPAPPRPELFVLADISGSVATFARFTLHLTQAMRGAFRGVRSFVFIDGLDEITDLAREAENVEALAASIDEAKAGLHFDGRSDYGHALKLFRQRVAPQLSSRSIVLILGDARSNYRRTAPDDLAAVAQRAGRVYWLNPERQALWGDGDSVMPVYAPLCDAVLECRTVRQLKSFVDVLA